MRQVDHPAGGAAGARLDRLLDQLESLLDEVDAFEEAQRESVFALLDGIDAVHRAALGRLGGRLGAGRLADLRSDPLIRWLLDAYGVGVDEMGEAEAALEAVRPFIQGHGGEVEVLASREGVVRVRLSGACRGCTASAVTRRRTGCWTRTRQRAHRRASAPWIGCMHSGSPG